MPDPVPIRLLVADDDEPARSLLAACAHDVSKADEENANAWRVLGEIFAEYEAGGRSTARVATGA